MLQNPDLVSLMSEYLDMEGLDNLSALDPATRTMTQKQHYQRDFSRTVANEMMGDFKRGLNPVKHRILRELKSKEGLTPSLVDTLDILVDAFTSSDFNSHLAELSDPVIATAVKQLLPDKYNQFVWSAAAKYYQEQFIGKLDFKDKERAYGLNNDQLRFILLSLMWNERTWSRDQLDDLIDFVRYYIDIHSESPQDNLDMNDMLVALVALISIKGAKRADSN